MRCFGKGIGIHARRPMRILSGEKVLEAVVDSSAVPSLLQVGASSHFFVEVQPESDRCATGVQAPKTPGLILNSPRHLYRIDEMCFSLLPPSDPAFSVPILLFTSLMGYVARKLAK